MKIANFSTRLLLAIALCTGVTACKKTPKHPTPIFGPGRNAPGGNNLGGMVENSGPAIPPGPETDVIPLPPLDAGSSGNPLESRPHNLDDYFQDREIFRQDTVYFDFDKYNVKPGELDKVQAVASYLQSQPAEAVLVEGHCDERGTPEYNRALGERRALSVRESLMSLGVDGNRVHTVSFGEDKPADLGHSENAYSKNRRADFVLLRLKSGAAESR